MTQLFAGVMSGTSLDGIDAILGSFGDDGSVSIKQTIFEPYPDDFQAILAKLMANPQEDSEIARLVDHQLGVLFSKAVLGLIENYSSEEIAAIGCHGQTILHEPDINSPFSWQAGDGIEISRRTGLPVVVDFRSADMRAGGQGAPFAPFFHNFAFRNATRTTAIVNIGGISNVTYLPAKNSEEDVIGFDTGPGNTLSNQWVKLHKNQPYDQDGCWALSSKPDTALLRFLMLDPYFNKPAPKSLDTRQFDIDWLQNRLNEYGKDLSADVVQSTIAAFSADTIWQGIRLWMPPVEQIFLCGGGAYNTAIVNRLKEISGKSVSTTDELGVSPNHVEACTFAWLAKCRISGIPASIPSVTGASKSVLLGKIFSPG